MATINLGSLKLNWTGAYNSSTSYAVDDIATANGNSYVCIQAHSNQAVGNATAYWNIMSSAGTNGSDGTDLSTTLSTRGDLVYKGASALTRLPKGTAGYYLKQGANDPEWATIAGGVSNAFCAEGSAGNASGVLVINNQLFDDGGNYDHTNGKYTAPSAGKYFFHFHALSAGSATDLCIKINGTTPGGQGNSWSYSPDGSQIGTVTVIYNLSAGDEVTCVAQNNNVYGNYLTFSGCKLY